MTVEVIKKGSVFKRGNRTCLLQEISHEEQVVLDPIEALRQKNLLAKNLKAQELLKLGLSSHAIKKILNMTATEMKHVLEGKGLKQDRQSKDLR